MHVYVCGCACACVCMYMCVCFVWACFVCGDVGVCVSVFVQLSSNGRTGIFSMVISWKFAQGPGAQFAFFLLGHHFCLRLTLRTFFFLHGSLLEPGRLDDKFTNYIEGSRKSSTGACSKRGWGVTHAYSGQIMGSNDKWRTWTVPTRVETDLRRCSGNPMPPCP